ncbi:MAG: phosphoribosylformylglycinamidine synthase subunit PurQ [Deltaproteobacteria bacterium]|nr:phosphoribosylformylglycinamidine synthase subunit PurQ [Deltaproteobacteria bacterium]
MAEKIRALVLTGYGLNCDHETAYSLRLAGAEADRVHVNELVGVTAEHRKRLSDYDMLIFDGGFSWGDDHGAGVLLALRLGAHLGPDIRNFLGEGKLVLGICNGFQALVNLGLLPGLDGDYTARRVALTWNDCGNFQNRWVNLGVNTDSPCVFTRHIEGLELPVRHGEGKFVAEESVLDTLEKNAQIVVRYASPNGSPAGGHFPDNPNGSLRDIAGICDPTGRVFGLMPHPEAYNHWTNHPNWTYQKEVRRRRGIMDIESPEGAGIQLFRNAVEYLKRNIK